MKFILCAALLAVSSRAATPTPRLNPDLVRPWSKELSSSEPFPYPYLATYEKNGFVLAYLAAVHGSSKSSPTSALLRRALEKKPFRAVVIEGFPFDATEDDKDRYLRYAESTSSGDFVGGGEDAEAAILAHSEGIPFYGGEPADADVLRGTLAQGYAARDLIGFYLVRMIPVWARNGKLKDSSLDRLAAGELGHVCRTYRLPPAECPDFAAVKRWYKDKNGKEFGEGFDHSELTPYRDGAFFTQRLSAAVDDVRNRAVVENIGTLLLKHGKVLVVYGGSHLTMQSKAFEEALGTPAYSR